MDRRVAAYRILENFLPGKAAIRTVDHDQDALKASGPSYVDGIEAKGGYTPAAFFIRSQLSAYPALIGTHNGYKKHPGDLLTLANGIRRDLILDERPDDVDVAEFTLADFERLHALCLAKLKLDEGEEPLLTQAFGEAHKQLASAQLALDRRHPYHELRLNLSEPLIAGLRGLAESSRKCSTLAAGTDFSPNDIRLAAKLIAAANDTPGFAFVALHTDYSHGAKFVVYAPNWRLRPATVLLDATSDIDGYAELSSVRVQEAVPEANYTQLEARLLNGPGHLTSYSPKDLWEHKDTRTPLLKWMHKCVLQSTHEGEKVLVVTWKNVIEGGQLQLLNWKEDTLAIVTLEQV